MEKRTLIKLAMLAQLLVTTVGADAQTDSLKHSQQQPLEKEHGQSESGNGVQEESLRSVGSGDDLSQDGLPSISPQAEALKKYGEFPMDYSTGVPNKSHGDGSYDHFSF